MHDVRMEQNRTKLDEAIEWLRTAEVCEERAKALMQQHFESADARGELDAAIELANELFGPDVPDNVIAADFGVQS